MSFEPMYTPISIDRRDELHPSLWRVGVFDANFIFYYYSMGRSFHRGASNVSLMCRLNMLLRELF